MIGKDKKEEKSDNGEPKDFGTLHEAVKNKVRENVGSAKIQELTSDLQRTRADFENFRKQIELRKEAERKAVRFATVCKILPLLDDIDRAIENYEELKPLAGTLEKTMKELSINKIEATDGAEFNPDLHEAVMAEGDGDKELISEVLRSGYYYEGEVIRPAMVKVKKI